VIVYLLFVYAKSDQSDVTSAQLKSLGDEIDEA